MRYLFLDGQDHGKGKQLPKRDFLCPKYVVSLQTSVIKMKQIQFKILSLLAVKSFLIIDIDFNSLY